MLNLYTALHSLPALTEGGPGGSLAAGLLLCLVATLLVHVLGQLREEVQAARWDASVDVGEFAWRLQYEIQYAVSVSTPTRRATTTAPAYSPAYSPAGHSRACRAERAMRRRLASLPSSWREPHSWNAAPALYFPTL